MGWKVREGQDEMQIRKDSRSLHIPWIHHLGEPYGDMRPVCRLLWWFQLAVWQIHCWRSKTKRVRMRRLPKYRNWLTAIEKLEKNKNFIAEEHHWLPIGSRYFKETAPWSHEPCRTMLQRIWRWSERHLLQTGGNLWVWEKDNLRYNFQTTWWRNFHVSSKLRQRLAIG